jgi:hypothetical protein
LAEAATDLELEMERRGNVVVQLHVTITGAEFAWMFTPPELSISAT